MSIVRLRFKDTHDLVIGDLEVSKETPVREMLPLILGQLGLDSQKDWKLILEQNRPIDLQSSFAEVGAREGSVVRVVTAGVPTMPLVQEIQLTVAVPQPRAAEPQRGQHPRDLRQGVAAITELLKRQRHVLVLGAPGFGKSHLIQCVRDQALAPGTFIYLDDFSSAKAALCDIARSLHQRHQLTLLREEYDSETVHRKLGRWQLEDLTTLVCDSLRGLGYVIVVGDLDSAAPAGVTALQELSRVATILAAASTDCLDRLAAIVGRFDRIEFRSDRTLDLVWILPIAIALALAFYTIGRAVNTASAYIVAGGLAVLALILRAALWKGLRMKVQHAS